MENQGKAGENPFEIPMAPEQPKNQTETNLKPSSIQPQTNLKQTQNQA